MQTRQTLRTIDQSQVGRSFKDSRQARVTSAGGKYRQARVTSAGGEYLALYELMPGIQSAYRRRHSTEAAILKVISDELMAAADDGQMTLLGLLDLSAAFDTVDYTISIACLRNAVEIQGLTIN